eukprot:g4948.t1
MNSYKLYAVLAAWLGLASTGYGFVSPRWFAFDDLGPPPPSTCALESSCNHSTVASTVAMAARDNPGGKQSMYAARAGLWEACVQNKSSQGFPSSMAPLTEGNGDDAQSSCHTYLTTNSRANATVLSGNMVFEKYLVFSRTMVFLGLVFSAFSAIIVSVLVSGILAPQLPLSQDFQSITELDAAISTMMKADMWQHKSLFITCASQAAFIFVGVVSASMALHVDTLAADGAQINFYRITSAKTTVHLSLAFVPGLIGFVAAIVAGIMWRIGQQRHREKIRQWMHQRFECLPGFEVQQPQGSLRRYAGRGMNLDGKFDELTHLLLDDATGKSGHVRVPSKLEEPLTGAAEVERKDQQEQKNQVVSAFSDTIGRRPIIMLSIFLQSLPLLALGLFPNNLWWYFGATVVPCLTSTAYGTSPVVVALVADMAGKKHRTAAMGVIFAMSAIGFSLGTIIGAYFLNVSAPTRNNSSQSPLRVGIADRIIYFGSVGITALLVMWVHYAVPETVTMAQTGKTQLQDEQKKIDERIVLTNQNMRAPKSPSSVLNPLRPFMVLKYSRLMRCIATIVVLSNVAEAGVVELFLIYLNDVVNFTAFDNAYVLLIVTVVSLFVQTVALQWLLLFGELVLITRRRSIAVLPW